jgi:hypothetical protein
MSDTDLETEVKVGVGPELLLEEGQLFQENCETPQVLLCAATLASIFMTFVRFTAAKLTEMDLKVCLKQMGFGPGLEFGQRMAPIFNADVDGPDSRLQEVMKMDSECGFGVFSIEGLDSFAFGYAFSENRYPAKLGRVCLTNSFLGISEADLYEQSKLFYFMAGYLEGLVNGLWVPPELQLQSEETVFVVDVQESIIGGPKGRRANFSVTCKASLDEKIMKLLGLNTDVASG